MKFLTKPDKNVFKTLGEGKLPDNGCVVRPSIYAVPYAIGEKKLIFNTLTRQTIEAEEYFELFKNPINFGFAASDAGIVELIKQRFVVKSDANEAKDYIGTVQVLRLLDKKLQRGHKGYVILPTTACNARCFYCYESGMKFKSMDEETSDDVVNYIIKSKSEGGISIRWFGGEPLMGEKAIDRICAGLVKNGVDFSSSIVTNASLVTPEIAEKMHRVWRITHAQVTLDGRRDEYTKRKAYVGGIKAPYEKVMNAIHLLLENRIRVSIRLNADENNIEDLFLLADELKAEFGEKAGVSVYANALFSCCQGGDCASGTEFHSRIGELGKKLHALGLAGGGGGARLRTYRCMADTPNGASVIAPDGKLFACEHMIEQSEVGSIYDHEKEWEMRKLFIEASARIEKRHECLNCPFLPECTVSAHCPVEGADCKLGMNSLIERKLLKFNE